MLVTSALSAILITLIYVGMQSSVETSKSTICLANLRQIGHLISLYCSDNQMKLPHANNNPYAWYVPLWPYASGGKTIYDGVKLEDFPFLQCPDGTEHKNALYDYAYDYDLSNRPLFEVQANLYYGSPVTGKRWLVIDGTWYFLRRSDGASGATGTQSIATLRHGKKANVLFPDFSVRSMSSQEINENLYIFKQHPISTP